MTQSKAPSTVLITGASSGIGSALAEQFARKGHNLILVARREESLKKIATELHRHYAVDTHHFKADLSAVGVAEHLFEIVSNYGLQVDILVNNAGRGTVGPFVETAAQTDIDTMELNMVSLTILCKLFGGEMVKRKQGKILNIASVAAFMPAPGFAVYHASKAFVLSLSEALAAELKPAGVTVTASCPGPTESEFHSFSGTDNLSIFKRLHLMQAETVAAEAYRATMKGTPLIIHGAMNKLMSISPRLTSRKMMTSMMQVLTK